MEEWRVEGGGVEDRGVEEWRVEWRVEGGGVEEWRVEEWRSGG